MILFPDSRRYFFLSFYIDNYRCYANSAEKISETHISLHMLIALSPSLTCRWQNNTTTHAPTGLEHFGHPCGTKSSMKKAEMVKIITGIIVKALPCCCSNSSRGLRISEFGGTIVSSGTSRHCARSLCHQPLSPELEVTRSRLQALVEATSFSPFCKCFRPAYVCSNMLGVVLCRHSFV